MKSICCKNVGELAFFIFIIFSLCATNANIFALDKGDVTGNGEIDGRDALKIMRDVKGYEPLTAEEKERADVYPPGTSGGQSNGDGLITEDDALRLLYQAVGLIPKGELTGNYSDSIPMITDFYPKVGVIGTEVTIVGKNFVESKPSENNIFFGDVPAEIISVTGTKIVVKVPTGALSAKIKVKTPGGLGESSIQFVVLKLITGKVSLGSGVDVQNFKAVSVYGESDIDPQTGEFTIPISQDGITILGAVPKGVGENSFLYVSIPQTGGGRKKADENIVIDAKSTALSLIFMHPFLITKDRNRSEQVMEIITALAEVSHLADVIAVKYPAGAAGLNDSEVESAWQSAVIAVLNALPSSVSFDITKELPLQINRTNEKQGKYINKNSVQNIKLANGLEVKVMGIDLDYLKFRYEDDAIVPMLSVDYSPVDWLIAMYRLDPADMPKGLSETFADIKKRNINRLKYEKSTMIASNQWTAKIDILGQGVNFVMDTVLDWVGIGGDSNLPIPEMEDSIYMLRCFSGSFKDRWLFSGDDAIAMKNVKNDIKLSNMATGINIVMGLLDVWGLVAGEEATPTKEAIKAGYQGAIGAIATQIGDKALGDFTGKEAVGVLVAIAIEAGKGIASSYISQGISSAKEKLQGAFKSVLGKSLPLLDLLAKISSVGRIGERIVGLMGYIINPLGLEIALGPTPLEVGLVMVGDPFSPVIESVSPMSGGIGTLVKIKGKRFAPNAKDNKVKFGNFKAEVVSASQDGTEISVRVPEGLIGSSINVTIYIETPAALKSGSFTGFIYKDIPVITNLSVTSGFGVSSNPVGKPYNSFAGTEVEIYGYKLNKPFSRPNHKVYFGTTEATIKYQIDKLIRVNVPSIQSTGPHDAYLRYTTDDGEEETAHLSFNVYGAPSINSVLPTSAPAGAVINVQGSNFFSTTVLVNNGNVNSTEADAGKKIILTMPNVGTPNQEMPLEIWNPAGMATQNITRQEGIVVPVMTPLPNGFKITVTTEESNTNKDGQITLDEAMGLAKGSFNFWTDGYDDTNEKWTHHLHEVREGTYPNYTYKWEEWSIDKEDLKTNSAGYETREHYNIRYYHEDHGGTITDPIYSSSENLDTTVKEEGDLVTLLGTVTDFQGYNGANFADQIVNDNTTHTYTVAGIEMGPQDKMMFDNTTLIVNSSGINLKEGNQLKVPKIQTTLPIICAGNNIVLSNYNTIYEMLIEGGSASHGIHILSSFGVNIYKAMVKNCSGHGIFIDRSGKCFVSGGAENATGDGLRFENSDENSVSFTATGCNGNGINIKDSKLNKITEFSATNSVGNGINVFGGQSNTISGPEINNCQVGVNLENTENFNLGATIRILNSKGNGITISGGGGNNLNGINGGPIIVLNSGGNGLEITDSYANYLSYVDVGGSIKNGIVFRGLGTFNNSLIKTNSGRYRNWGGDHSYIISGNGENGVYLYDGANNNYIGKNGLFITSTGNTENGILVSGEGTDNNIFYCYVGHWFYNYEQTAMAGNKKDGIKLSGGASNNTITNSQINDNEGNGISLSGSGTNYNMINNSYIGTLVITGGKNPGAKANKGYGIHISDSADFNTFKDLKIGIHNTGGIYCSQITSLPQNNKWNMDFRNIEIGFMENIQYKSKTNSLKLAKSENSAGIGIHLNNCANSYFLDTIIKYYNNGIEISGDSSTGFYIDAEVSKCTQDGIYFNGIEGNNYFDIDSHENGRDGIVFANVENIDTSFCKIRSTNNTNHGYLIDTCQNSIFTELNAYQNGGDGIQIINSNNLNFNSSYFYQNLGSGINLQSGSNQISFIDCPVEENEEYGLKIFNTNQISYGISFLAHEYAGVWYNTLGGIFIENSTNIDIGNNLTSRRLDISTEDNPSVTITGSTTENVNILNCNISSSDVDANIGILVNGGKNITIGDITGKTQNYVSGGLGAGVQGEGNVQNLRIINNFIVGPMPNQLGGSPSSVGVLLQNGISGVIISGNTISNNIFHGIAIKTGANSNVITRNEIKKNGGDGIRIEGNGTNKNLIISNSITSNMGKGIALSNGGNDQIAAPDITNISPSSMCVSGVINPVPPQGSRVEVYTDKGDEGETLLGESPVFGNNFSLLTNVPNAKFLHAVAIHPNGNTSEFGTTIQTPNADWYSFIFTEETTTQKKIMLNKPFYPYITTLTKGTDNEYDAQAGSLGEGLIYVSDSAGNEDIWLRSASLSSPMRYTIDSAPDYSPSWLKGKNIVSFVSERDGNPEIYKMNINLTKPIGELCTFSGSIIGNTARKTGDGFGAVFSHAGETITQIQYYISANPAPFEWKILDMVNNAPSTVIASGTTTPTLTGWHTINISSINAPSEFFVAIIYQTDQAPGIGLAYSNLGGRYFSYVMKNNAWYSSIGSYYMIRAIVEPKPPTRLTDNAARDLYPAWSKDGNKIAFASDREGSLDIWLMGADGANPTKLTDGIGNNIKPSWSPDNSKIAFTSNRNGDNEIYIINADGSGLERLTNNAADDTEPVWTEDGQFVLFSSNREGGYEIYGQKPGSNSAQRLTYILGDSRDPDSVTDEFVENVGYGLFRETVQKSQTNNSTKLEIPMKTDIPSTITLTLNNASASPGGDVNLTIDLKDANNLGNLAFEIIYDPAILEVKSKPTVGINSGAISAIYPDVYPDDNGRLVFNLVNADGFDGMGTAFTIPLRVKPFVNVLQTPLTISDAKAYMIDYTSMPIEINHGVIKIIISSGNFWMLR